MKILQIQGGVCHWDATKQFPTLESTVGFFPPEVLFVEAPDYVYEGWGYLNGEFIKPTPPEGWLYDDKTGTFYLEDQSPPQPSRSDQEVLADLLVDHEYRITLLELGL